MTQSGVPVAPSVAGQPHYHANLSDPAAMPDTGAVAPIVSHLPVLIAGGGIGGLATAIALALRGIPTRILERRPEFGEVGAGIQIGPNGVRVLRTLGVFELLAPHAGAPAGISIRDGVSGHSLAVLPLGQAIETRLGAPYWTAHRADLHTALLARARQFSSIRFTMGFEARGFNSTVSSVRAKLSAGEDVEGAALIAADGLWSSLRASVAPEVRAVPAARRAYRAVIPANAAPAALAATRMTGLWLAPGAHVVHYPVRGGQEIALVVIVADREGTEGWNAAVTTEEVRAFSDRLAAPLRSLIAAAETWAAWTLYEMPRLPRWSRGRVALLGDAAHPTLPFLAQGAVMALEDALVIAASLSRQLAVGGADLPRIEAAFSDYEKSRRTRVYRVIDAAQRNGQVYHLSGAAALARNLVLQATPGSRLIAGYDWLYGFETADSIPGAKAS